MSDPEELEVVLLAGRMEVRGTCAYTLRLAERLTDCGIAATLISLDLSRVSPAARSRTRAREYRRAETPLWGVLARCRMLRDLRTQSPALVHVQSRQALGAGMWLARRLRRPFVLTVHDHLSSCERLRLDRRACARIVAVSHSVRDDLVDRHGFPPSLVTVIPTGVDVPPREECPPVLEPGRVPVIGTAGPLESVKGLPFFLGAARMVLDVRPELEFLVAGAGPEEANLRRIARGLNIGQQVTFVPNLQDFGESLRAMDVFCLPSLQQGLGTIMLEAMALGRPVIASNVGGVATAVRHEETGLVVPPGDSAVLARRILELLDDPARARSLGALARRVVAEEFDAGRMALQTAELYREICTCQPKSFPLAPS